MRTRFYFILTATLLAVAATGCSGADDPQPATDTMNVAFHMRVSPKANDGSGKVGDYNDGAWLLLFKYDDFHYRWMLGPDSSESKSQTLPFFELATSQSVNSYTYASGNTYETPFAYPADGTYLFATGLAPYSAISFEQMSTQGYTLATVASNARNGNVDFLCCDGNSEHIGAYDHDPLYTESASFLAEEHELKFHHLTSKIVVYGQRSPETYNTTGVRDVMVTIDDDNVVVPIEFKLYTEQGSDEIYNQSTYVISNTTKYTGTMYSRGTINMGEVKPLDSCYVVTKSFTYGKATGQFDPFRPSAFKDAAGGTPQLRLNVKATLFVPGSEMASVDVDWPNMPVAWTGDVLTGSQLLPGYEYRIYLTFNRSGIALRAEAVPWQDGGYHVLPVVPKTQKAKQ